MTREEWQNSSKCIKLRILGNLVAEAEMKLQQARDMLAVLDADEGPLVGDRFSLAERQLRVTELEIQSLRGRINNFQSMLTPRCSDDEGSR